MHEKNILINTSDGNLDCRCFYTNKQNNPGIVFYMDAPAIREELRIMCRRIATQGYNVYLPNLFYRLGIEGNYPFDQRTYKNNKIEAKKMLNTMNSTTNQMILDDTKYILNFLREDIENNKKVGIVGYCMSGRFIVYCAAFFPHIITAAASFYGVDICTKEKCSPHLFFERIKGELYLGFAAEDIWISEKQILEIKKALGLSGINYELEIYPQTTHGFAFPERSSYKKTAAELHWKKLFNLFEKNLVKCPKL